VIKHLGEVELYGEFSCCLVSMHSSEHQHYSYCTKENKLNKARWKKRWGKVIIVQRSVGGSLLLPCSISQGKMWTGMLTQFATTKFPDCGS